MIIDFTELPLRKKTYAGANGGKLAVIYNNEQYMLKFPGYAKLNTEMNYSNGCVSEYLGSHIFNMLGVKAQETLLGIYRIEDNIAEVLGVTNDYGDYAAIIEDDTIPDDTELLIKMVSLNKHFEISNYLGFKNALNPDDNGAMSGGILQWRGANYRDMLQYVYNTNPDEYKSIAKKYTGNLVQIVDYSSSWWQKHTIKTTDSEYRFYQELFSTDWASEAQWNYAIEYERKVLEDARSHGVTDEKTIILM